MAGIYNCRSSEDYKTQIKTFLYAFGPQEELPFLPITDLSNYIRTDIVKSHIKMSRGMTKGWRIGGYYWYTVQIKNSDNVHMIVLCQRIVHGVMHIFLQTAIINKNDFDVKKETAYKKLADFLREVEYVEFEKPNKIHGMPYFSNDIDYHLEMVKKYDLLTLDDLVEGELNVSDRLEVIDQRDNKWKLFFSKELGLNIDFASGWVCSIKKKGNNLSFVEITGITPLEKDRAIVTANELEKEAYLKMYLLGMAEVRSGADSKNLGGIIREYRKIKKDKKVFYRTVEMKNGIYMAKYYTFVNKGLLEVVYRLGVGRKRNLIDDVNDSDNLIFSLFSS
ncbi:MAG: hypothetical protein ABIH71_05460 [Candidatus Omnitrophota bacterium]